MGEVHCNSLVHSLLTFAYGIMCGSTPRVLVRLWVSLMMSLIVVKFESTVIPIIGVCQLCKRVLVAAVFARGSVDSYPTNFMIELIVMVIHGFPGFTSLARYADS